MLTTVAGCVMHPVQPLFMEAYMIRCSYCPDNIAVKRAELGYTTCLSCGAKQASEVRHCVVPLHKSNYIVVTNRAELIGINSKGGLVK